MRHDLTCSNAVWHCRRCGTVFEALTTAEEIGKLPCPGAKTSYTVTISGPGQADQRDENAYSGGYAFVWRRPLTTEERGTRLIEAWEKGRS